MVALADLAPASFRGASFLAPKDLLDEGPNTIDHKFPGQGIKTRLAQDNGASPPEYQITCVLHGPTLSADWPRFRAALNQGGSGTLVHPWLGRRTVAVKGPYKVHRDDHESGILKIEVCFLETATVSPSNGVLFPATVTFLADGAINNAFAIDFALPSSPFSLSYLFSAISAFANSVLAQFASVATVALGVATILASPLSLTLLAPTLIALFRGPFDDKTVTNIQLVTGYAAVFSELETLALDAGGIDPTTEDLLERQAAADAILTACMAACVAALCDGMAAKAQGNDYKTADEVGTDVASLTDAWTTLSDRSLDPDLRATLLDLYARTSAILESLEVTLPKIVALNVPSVPASVLSYWLYETDAKEDALAGLNPDLPPLLYDGTVNVLSQ